MNLGRYRKLITYSTNCAKILSAALLYCGFGTLQGQSNLLSDRDNLIRLQIGTVEVQWQLRVNIVDEGHGKPSRHPLFGTFLDLPNRFLYSKERRWKRIQYVDIIRQFEISGKQANRKHGQLWRHTLNLIVPATQGSEQSNGGNAYMESRCLPTRYYLTIIATRQGPIENHHEAIHHPNCSQLACHTFQHTESRLVLIPHV
jgi:hypothetical protein